MSEKLKTDGEKDAKVTNEESVSNTPNDSQSRIEILKLYPSKGEGGSWLYGIILMMGGVLFFILGLLELLNISFIYAYLVDQGLTDIAVMLPVMGVPNFAISFFAVIAGYGLIVDQEWGWGIAMFILVYTATQSIVNITATVINLSYNPSLIISNVFFWLSIFSLVIAVVGLIYLGLTKYKYA